MKFEKITNNQLRIIFTIDDMILNNISSQSLLSDRITSKKLFQSILSEAEKEVGFKAEDNNLLVKAMKSSDGGFIFTITKLSSDNTEQFLNNCNLSQNLLFKFDCFDDFVNGCTFFRNIHELDFKTIFCGLSFTLYNGIYYLHIFDLNINFYNYIINILVEFGELVPYNASIIGCLNEYGKTIFTRKNLVKFLKSI